MGGVQSASVIGVDPGGASKLGLAALDVRRRASKWSVQGHVATAVVSVDAALDWIEHETTGKTILGLGIDTLTEWSTAPGGWRPADLWLRRQYPAVRRTVQCPNAMWSAVVMSGATLLVALRKRLRRDGTLVTEAHPKICYYACTGTKHNWANDRQAMTSWIQGEIGQTTNFGLGDDEFDASLAALAAFNSLRGAWSRDLHALSWGSAKRVSFAGRTHYFWP